MSQTPNYERATNAAYELLSRKSSFSLSTNVFDIIETMLENCRLLTYSQASFIYGYDLECLLECSEYGFSLIYEDKRIILYNEKVPLGCIRFTIAHEIAHAALNHQIEGDLCSEKEANCFARNLLCPIPVVYTLALNCVNDYISVFDVTSKMATISYEYMSRDRYYITKENWAVIEAKLDAFMFGFEHINDYYQYLVS